MRKVLILPIIIFLILQVSCERTILRIAELRMPEIETKESIYKFLKKINEDTNEVYTLDSTLFQQLRKEKFKPGMEKGFRPVQIRMYGKNGEPVMQWASCEGFISDLKIFDSAPPKIFNGIDTSLNVYTDLSRYYTLDGKPAKIKIPENYDYYVLIYFAKYFPKMSKESFSQVNRYIFNHPEIKVKIYKINVDVQEFWHTDLDIETQTQIGGDK